MNKDFLYPSSLINPTTLLPSIRRLRCRSKRLTLRDCHPPLVLVAFSESLHWTGLHDDEYLKSKAYILEYIGTGRPSAPPFELE